ncbi:MAG TPA: hypothetical protein PLN69_02930 [bacterium]|nr:hypothetical protein [bacterium]
MKRKILFPVSIFLLLISVSCLGQELTDPKEILSEAKDKMMALDSYSYYLKSEGWDFDLGKTAEKTKSLTGEASKNSLASRFTGDVEEVDASEPKWMVYEGLFKFMKPYFLQMHLEKNDYVPSILQGAVMTYRPDKKKGKYWTLKPRISPIGIKRGTETVSGSFFYSTWHLNFMKIEGLLKAKDPVLEGVEDFDGHKCYRVTFEFTGDETGAAAAGEYEKWGIPEQVQWKFNEELDEFTRGNHGKISYLFDVDELLLRKLDVKQKNGEQYYVKTWTDVKTNDLTKKDF